MVIAVIFFTLLTVANIQCAIFFDTGAYRKECIDDLNLDTSPQRAYGDFFVTNSQIRDLQCLDRCILIKSGIIDENESVQPTRLQEQFRNVPNFNISTNFNEICTTY
ncbi:PBP/GOBP family [Popillia japonica]|uniref:PBP/GOBP family n=1 Tax=Popillia japonica TaxID=7064 RepID=A0AAW1MKS0_POPJA